MAIYDTKTGKAIEQILEDVAIGDLDVFHLPSHYDRYDIHVDLNDELKSLIGDIYAERRTLVPVLLDSGASTDLWGYSDGAEADRTRVLDELKGKHPNAKLEVDTTTTWPSQAVEACWRVRLG